MKNKMIGIVGGIGSYAGIDLIRKIYDLTPVTKDQEHLPVNMLSIPEKVLDRTEYLVGKIDENPGIAIGEIIETLVENGAEVIGIPCNTAHAQPIFEKIQERSDGKVEIVHLIEEVGRFLAENHPEIKKVGILATNGTTGANVYPDTLLKYGIEAIQPPEDLQKQLVHPAIYDPEYGIKAKSNPVQEKARADLLKVAAFLTDQGAQALILGCTEIPLAIHETQLGDSIVIDATEVLAKGLIRASRGRGEGANFK